MRSKPILSAIVAMDQNRLIGKDNSLPWHLPADLKHFKASTMNKPIVMGRKTWDSIGRPLPGRDNIVISRDADLQIEGTYVVASIDAAIDKALSLNPEVEEIMFMGGVTIYEQVMPRINRLYLTQIDYTFSGDAWFPEFDRDAWQEVSRDSHQHQNGEQTFDYHFILLEKNDITGGNTMADKEAAGSKKKTAKKTTSKKAETQTKVPNVSGKTDRVAIVDGLRTPFARQASVYSGLSAVDLARLLVSELIARTNIDPKLLQRVVYGQVVVLPEAPNIAREIVLSTPLDIATDAYSVSRACATSFQSTVNVAESIMAGDIDAGIAGGADSASVVPIQFSRKLSNKLVAMQKAKSIGQKLALLKGVGIKDILPVPPAVAEYSTGLRMGDSAEQMAKDYGITREAQDDLTLRSHMLANQAWEQGKLDQEVMTANFPPYKKTLERDENIRPNSTLEKLAKLRPAFDRKHGTVTAANSTPLTDGASALILMRESVAKAQGYEPLGYIKSYAFTAGHVDHDLLMGPSYSTPIALDKAGLRLSDLTLVDMHEAFAAQTLCNVQAFGSKKFAEEKLNRSEAIGEIDMEKFNVIGGSIAYGHPFAATGARMITQTLHELKRRGGGLALNTACAAGGLGAAMILEAE